MKERSNERIKVGTSRDLSENKYKQPTTLMRLGCIRHGDEEPTIFSRRSRGKPMNSMNELSREQARLFQTKE